MPWLVLDCSQCNCLKVQLVAWENEINVRIFLPNYNTPKEMETFSPRNLHNPILSAFPIIIWSRHACHSIDILAKRNSCNARCLKYEKYELKSLIKGGLNFKALYSQMEKFGQRTVAKQIVHTHVFHAM